MMAQEVKKIKLDPSKVKGRWGYHAIKRGFDILASGIALILLSPLFLVLIILIKKRRWWASLLLTRANWKR